MGSHLLCVPALLLVGPMTTLERNLLRYSTRIDALLALGSASASSHGFTVAHRRDDGKANALAVGLGGLDIGCDDGLFVLFEH